MNAGIRLKFIKTLFGFAWGATDLIYLIFLSIILESFHLIIPNRGFEFSDLFGNLAGVIFVVIIYKVISRYA